MLIPLNKVVVVTVPAIRLQAVEKPAQKLPASCTTIGTREYHAVIFDTGDSTRGGKKYILELQNIAIVWNILTVLVLLVLFQYIFSHLWIAQGRGGGGMDG